MYRTKRNSFHLYLKSKKGPSDRLYLKRVCDFSLDFLPFEPSVLDGARSKVDLRGEGYVWALILWSFDNSNR